MKREDLEAIVEARAARRPVVRVLDVASGDARIVDPAGPIEDGLREAVAGAVRRDRAALIEADERRLFVQPFNPSLRLAIVGAVHIAQRLARLALDLGYAVTVIDPRQGFLTAARFPGVERDPRWPGEALADFALDARSACVTLSHDAKIDEPALEAALTSEAFYVGALGSKRTQAKRRARLLESGLDEAALDRIHGPVGLDLGAQSPAEIALSIAAELTATLRDRA